MGSSAERVPARHISSRCITPLAPREVAAGDRAVGSGPITWPSRATASAPTTSPFRRRSLARLRTRWPARGGAGRGPEAGAGAAAQGSAAPKL